MHLVKIRYGPYLCHGVIDHRIQKINGLFNALNSLGYDLEVVPINEYNRLSIIMHDREVFRCDIRNLLFNMAVEDDPVCQRAVKAVEEAKERMFSDENIPRFGPLEEGTRKLSPDENRASVEKSLPSGTDLLFEIHPNQPITPHHTMSRQLPLKAEEKVSRVKILEDKNTIIGQYEE